MWGDTKENTAPAHKECHAKFHAYGPSLEKPVPKKEHHMDRVIDAPKPDESVTALLSEDANKPLDRNLVELIARGLRRPNAGIVQRLAIEYLKLAAMRELVK
jgi:hypothetical protein